jgi:hypothetical protein
MQDLRRKEQQSTRESPELLNRCDGKALAAAAATFSAVAFVSSSSSSRRVLGVARAYCWRFRSSIMYPCMALCFGDYDSRSTCMQPHALQGKRDSALDASTPACSWLLAHAPLHSGDCVQVQPGALRNQHV